MEKWHPSRPISRVLCDGLPRPAIIPLGARVAAWLKQPTRGSDGASSTVSPEGVTSVWPCSRRGLPGRPPFGGRRWSLTPPFHPRLIVSNQAMRFSVALIRQVAPPWVLPGVVLCGARTFLDPVIGIAIARSTWIPGLLYHETPERLSESKLSSPCVSIVDARQKSAGMTSFPIAGMTMLSTIVIPECSYRVCPPKTRGHDELSDCGDDDAIHYCHPRVFPSVMPAKNTRT